MSVWSESAQAGRDARGYPADAELHRLIDDVVETASAPERAGVSPGEHAIMQKALELVPGADPEVCKSLAQDIASFVQDRAFRRVDHQHVGTSGRSGGRSTACCWGVSGPGPLSGAVPAGGIDYVVQHYETVGAGA